MRRLSRILALLLALSLFAAACGDDDDDGGGGTATGDGDDTEDTQVDLSGEELEVAAVWAGTEQERFEEVLANFEEETGASVTFISTGDDIAAALGPRIQAGDPPDVAILPQPGLLRDYAAQGILTPIEDVAGDLVDENYAPVWRELGTVDGELYGVWFKASNKSLVWYNTTVFEDAGVEPAEDWDGFLESAQTISDFGVTPVSVGGADGWTLTDWFENVYLRTAGAETYDQLVDHEIPWTDQSVKDALATLGELFGTPELLVGGTDGALQTDFNTSVTQVFVDPPAGAMVYEGDFVAGTITGDTSAELGTDADVFPFPSIDGSGPAIVGSGDVAVMMEQSEAAEELIRYLASPESGEIWAGLSGFVSPNQAVEIEAYPDEISQTIASSLVEAETFRFDLSDLQPAEFGATVGQGLFKLFQDYLADPSAIDTVTEQMEAAAAAAFGG